MLVKKFTAVVVLLVLLGQEDAVNAQGLLPSGKAIGERLDEFGRTIFGGLLSGEDAHSPKENSQKNGQANRSTTKKEKFDPFGISEEDSQSRSGSILTPSNPNRQTQTGDTSARSVRVYRSDSDNPSSYAAASKARSARRYIEDNQEAAEAADDLFPLSRAPAGQPIVVTPTNREAGVAEEAEDQGIVISRPLHERFSQFRRSAFDDSPQSDTIASSPSTAIISTDTSPADSSFATNPEAGVSESMQSTPMDWTSDSTEASLPTASKAAPVKIGGRPTLAKRAPGTGTAGLPRIAARTAPPMQRDGKVYFEDQSPAAPDAGKESGLVSETPGTPAVKGDSVLFARKGPALSVETLGPRKITVGKESTYEVQIINSGDVAAEELVVLVDFPEWAEVIGADAGIGTVQRAGPGQAFAPLQWNAGRLEAKSRGKLTLRIVPRQSRPFDLAVRWQYKPVASQTMIEVQEPRLEMKLEGPREVFYGRKETYRLRISNSGTGNAEGVVIKLTPVGSGENVPAVYQLGLLGAGEEKIIEVELTARQSGTLEIQVEGHGDAGNSAQLSEKVLVRRAGLEIDAEGPKLQFVGATAAYSLRVRNCGNAPAKNIKFSVQLAPGLKYAGGIEGARREPGGNKLQWTVETLNPEAVQTFTIKCMMGAAGMSRLEVAAAADDDLSASAVAVTQVESVANLTLDVEDPGGPVRVGDETAYKIHLINRGTKEAEGVEVFGYFSRGIEPTGAEGGANRVEPGQVVFLPIPALAPGAEKVLKIIARAEAPGNHIFRAEVHCKTLGTRLVSEDTTLYYQDAPLIPQNSQARPPQRGVR
jgi:uncharacterized repeat protein (TIGR01451 family)